MERLQARIDAGAIELTHDERTGYLRSVLAELRVPISSQTLVFSKTSLQQSKIRPGNPRALYFNDDVYVGYVRSGDVIELSVADPGLGTVFYTLDQSVQTRPQFLRQTENCLICHGGSHTRGIPGHLVRSVYPDPQGQPLFSAGSYRVDHTTPFAHRWGGWYVTGTHGTATHLGNITYRERPQGDDLANPAGLNLLELGDRIPAVGYLSKHSDLVALMVLAHQVCAHNVLAKASYDSRSALFREAALNRELREPEGHRWPSTNTVLDSAVASIVECFLFCDEAALASPLAGTSTFAADFVAGAAVDSAGRSLRQFDLSRRLFRYPCSYVVYTDSFEALPAEVRARFWQRLDAILDGRDQDPRFAHLSPEDRSSVRTILAATKRGVPAGWKVNAELAR